MKRLMGEQMFAKNLNTPKYEEIPDDVSLFLTERQKRKFDGHTFHLWPDGYKSLRDIHFNLQNDLWQRLEKGRFARKLDSRLSEMLGYYTLLSLNAWLHGMAQQSDVPWSAEVACGYLSDSHIAEEFHIGNPKTNTIHTYSYYRLMEKQFPGFNTPHYGGSPEPSQQETSVIHGTKELFDAQNPNLSLVMCAATLVGPQDYPKTERAVLLPQYDYASASHTLGTMLCYNKSVGQFVSLNGWVGVEEAKAGADKSRLHGQALFKFCEKIKKDAAFRASISNCLNKQY